MDLLLFLKLNLSTQSRISPVLTMQRQDKASERRAKYRTIHRERHKSLHLRGSADHIIYYIGLIPAEVQRLMPPPVIVTTGAAAYKH